MSGNFKKRNRRSLDIARDILVVASVNVGKTRIMYQANLSFVQVNKYLHDLSETGLLNHGDSRYLITKKGMEFLRLYDDYIKRCTRLKEQVDRSVKERQLLEHMCFNSNPDCKAENSKVVTVS